MRYRLLSICLLLVLLVPFVVHAQDSADVDAAKTVVAKFVSGDVAGLYAQFGDQMKAAVTQDQLAQAWPSLIASEGAFQKITDINAGSIAHSVVLTLQFEKGSLTLSVVFDTDGKITGCALTRQRAQPPSKRQRPPTPMPANSLKRLSRLATSSCAARSPCQAPLLAPPHSRQLC